MGDFLRMMEERAEEYARKTILNPDYHIEEDNIKIDYMNGVRDAYELLTKGYDTV